jgi:hypothetical protein
MIRGVTSAPTTERARDELIASAKALESGYR